MTMALWHQSSRGFLDTAAHGNTEQCIAALRLMEDRGVLMAVVQGLPFFTFSGLLKVATPALA